MGRRVGWWVVRKGICTEKIVLISSGLGQEDAGRNETNDEIG